MTLTAEIRILVLFAMIFLHVVDDYYLQGILASMKQKDWWPKQFPQNTMPKKYANDYKAALAAHAFSWSFMAHLPIVVCYFLFNLNTGVFIGWILFMLVQAFFHGFIDNEKANLHSINLNADQILHLGQILVSWLFTMICLV